MNVTAIMNTVRKVVNKTAFQLQKHSPEILVAVGVTGGVVSAVLACKATTKVNDILDESKDTIEKIHGAASGELKTTEPYSEEDAKKDLAITYVQTGIELAKLYAPAIAVGALSVVCILASTNILKKRNVALAAAYATIDNSFKEYRNHVIERFGEKVDKELKYDIKEKIIEEKTVDKKGKEKTEIKTVFDMGDPTAASPYARFFEEFTVDENGNKVKNDDWSDDPEYNLMFLKSRQAYANDKLRANGKLFLNDVYDMLNLPKTKAGQVVGWIYDPDNPVGDNYVDFGLYIGASNYSDFVYGTENAILLDFNVDGNIWELL